MYCKDAEINGKLISAYGEFTHGDIGGWKIDANYLYITKNNYHFNKCQKLY